ncbi:hypothetical protein BFV94_4974 [Alteromonas macleodii]|uniref:Phage protein n=1 Tax=Alteromonas macleodii TaxID=28108 RepID=A0AB36FL98_ALTMA|nr:hypothetical protein BFV94_4974 [Alteromonas macleodii]OES24104.1 hypothetical protein BFV93_4857 [Alteromonas macleodii]OES25031.1 hypothetical protein BFV95_4499 [Alteromonas macleodii]OES38701.1 hypothetical protein BFV96_4812 [Alteromonas macleodii]
MDIGMTVEGKIIEFDEDSGVVVIEDEDGEQFHGYDYQLEYLDDEEEVENGS